MCCEYKTSLWWMQCPHTSLWCRRTHPPGPPRTLSQMAPWLQCTLSAWTEPEQTDSQVTTRAKTANQSVFEVMNEAGDSLTRYTRDNQSPEADLGGGGGGGGRTLSLRDSTPCRIKGSSLCTILRYQFLVTDSKIFLKAPFAPIYYKLEGERAPKKRSLLVKIVQKSA